MDIIFDLPCKFLMRNVRGRAMLPDLTVYRISSVKRRSFFSFQNNPKDLDPSCKTDLDPCDFLGRVKLVL